MKKFILSSALISFSISGFAEAPKPAANPATNPAGNTKVSSAVIDCNYKIPASTAKIEDATLLQWSEKAAKQSFDFKHDMIDKQLVDLKACFTEAGWKSFSDALQKSGNLAAIKSQKLNVNSTLAGNATVAKVKDNEWKINVPLDVVYQNDKETLKQALIVDLLVGRKPTGDLGIMQIVVAPKDTKAPASPAPKTSSNSAH
jgi:hypothetical protein